MVLKIVGIFLIGILLALLVAPFIFKDKILAELKSKINQNINAEVEFKDIDVSFFKSFPEVSLSLKDVKVVGVDTFYQVDLLKAEKLTLDLNITPLFNKTTPWSLKYFAVEKGEINLVVLNDTLANYLITKPSSDTSSFNLALDKYELIDCNLIYDDISMPMKINSKGVSHSGKGNLATNLYDLETNSNIDSLSVIYDGFTFINNAKTAANAKINVDLLKRKFTLKDNSIKINKLDFQANGFVELQKNENIFIDGDFKTTNQSFSNFLSVMPYLAAYNTANASGTTDIKGKISGIFNSKRKAYPCFDVGIDIKNGKAQYAGLSTPINNVNGKINLSAKKSNLSDLLVQIKNFNASVGNEKINGDFDILNSTTNPQYVGFIKANMNLANWAKALPMPSIKALNGDVNVDLKFDAKQSDINSENYPAIQFDGKAFIKELSFTQGDKVVSIPSMNIDAIPSKVDIQATNMKFGKSDMSLNGSIINPMAYFSDIKNIEGKIKLNSNILDLNEWMSENNQGGNSTSVSMMPDISAYKYNELDVDFEVGQMLFGNHKFSAMNGAGKLGFENMDIQKMNLNLDGSDMCISGKLANIYSYLFGDATLNGDLNFNSKNFDSNKFMVQSESGANQDSILFNVPERISINLNSKIDNLKYTDMDIKNFNGAVLIKDRSFLLTDINANLLGGKVNFDGFYATKGGKPDFNFKLDLAKLGFVQSYKQFNTIRALAPLANYIDGVFNTTLVMEGKLNKGMIPDFSTLTVDGFLETLNGFIKGFKPIQAAADKLGLKELENLNIENTKNWFELKKGLVEVKEFTKTIRGIDMKISGNHQIKGDMNYLMFLKVPRSILQKNKVTSTVNKGIKLLESEAAKRGVNIAQGEMIDIKVTIGGRLNDPKISIIPLGTSGKSLKEEIKTEINDKIAQAKDSIKRVVENKVNVIKDSINKRGAEEVEKIKDKATQKAEEVLNNAKKQAQEKVESKIDTLLGKVVSDSLKQKAGDIIKEKTGKDIEDIKNKVKDWNPFKKKKKDGQ
jgi:hypothetical protein